MKDKKSKNLEMNEEEYLLNRDIIDEMANKTSASKRNFLI
jgi:hypothetical protein